MKSEKSNVVYLNEYRKRKNNDFSEEFDLLGFYHHRRTDNSAYDAMDDDSKRRLLELVPEINTMDFLLTLDEVCRDNDEPQVQD